MSGSAALLAVVVTANLAATAAFGAIGVATPFIAKGLGVPPAHGPWIPDAFLVAVVCVTPLAAWLRPLPPASISLMRRPQDLRYAASDQGILS